LIRSHDIFPEAKKKRWFFCAANVLMMGGPALFFESLGNIYVDGLVNALDVGEFVDDFNAQTRNQTTIVSLRNYQGLEYLTCSRLPL
jgi:hypothetical protein